MSNPLESLTQINLDDLVSAFGWQHHARLSRMVRAVFHRPARDFARQMRDFDHAIGARGLAEAACLTERLYVRDVRVFGADCLPAGPCLFLANHPGMTDTLALFTALARPDLRVIALDRPFLLSLPNLSRQLYYVTDSPQERVSLVRRVHRHLKAGGSVLTFPAGHNEPDPDVYPGAVDSLQAWMDSVGVFVRLAPEIAVVPVCVRSVSWAAMAHHPLVHLRRTADDQQLLASAMQLLSNVALRMRPVTVKVQIGDPIYAGDLGSTDTAVIHRAVLRSMQSMIEHVPAGEGQSAL
ncbi:MAG: 1-acyl-sn-glycerol-3-phosphate acyltransferase [Anaerolineales bacterium]